MQSHLAHLLALAPVQNPSTGIEWFVISPFLGGPQSAVVKMNDNSASSSSSGSGRSKSGHRKKLAQAPISLPASKGSAFAHRDLKIVWEIYAKHLDESIVGSASEVDLVKLVTAMAEDLGPPEAVCTKRPTGRLAMTLIISLQILHMLIQSSPLPNTLRWFGALPIRDYKS